MGSCAIMVYFCSFFLVFFLPFSFLMSLLQSGIQRPKSPWGCLCPGVGSLQPQSLSCCPSVGCPWLQSLRGVPAPAGVTHGCSPLGCPALAHYLPVVCLHAHFQCHVSHPSWLPVALLNLCELRHRGLPICSRFWGAMGCSCWFQSWLEPAVSGSGMPPTRGTAAALCY